MNIVKAALFGATIGGIAIFLWFLGVFGLNQNPFFGFWANLVILIVGITVLTTQLLFRNKNKESAFSFGHGVMLGGLTTLFAGIIGGLLILVTAQYFLPESIEIYRSEALKHLMVNKNQLVKESSEAIYQAYLDSIPKISAFNSVQRHFTSNILIPGLMFSFLSALALRKNAIGEK